MVFRQWSFQAECFITEGEIAACRWKQRFIGGREAGGGRAMRQHTLCIRWLGSRLDLSHTYKILSDSFWSMPSRIKQLLLHIALNYGGSQGFMEWVSVHPVGKKYWEPLQAVKLCVGWTERTGCFLSYCNQNFYFIILVKKKGGG